MPKVPCTSVRLKHQITSAVDDSIYRDWLKSVIDEIFFVRTWKLTWNKNSLSYSLFQWIVSVIHIMFKKVQPPKNPGVSYRTHTSMLVNWSFTTFRARETDGLCRHSASVARTQPFPRPRCRELAGIIQQSACDSARQYTSLLETQLGYIALAHLEIIVHFQHRTLPFNCTLKGYFWNYYMKWRWTFSLNDSFSLIMWVT
jgi:hypothetical protein